jgi:arsenate reductase
MGAILYGIPNCDTVKKARNWLDLHKVDYRFHDYRAAGIEKKRLEAWCKTAGWEVVLNKNSTTFKALPEAERAGLDRDRAIALMQREPTIIKRPVMEEGGRVIVGFKPEVYERAFG